MGNRPYRTHLHPGVKGEGGFEPASWFHLIQHTCPPVPGLRQMVREGLAASPLAVCFPFLTALVSRFLHLTTPWRMGAGAVGARSCNHIADLPTAPSICRPCPERKGSEPRRRHARLLVRRHQCRPRRPTDNRSQERGPSHATGGSSNSHRGSFLEHHSRPSQGTRLARLCMQPWPP